MSRRHGNLNFDPQVMDDNKRGESANFYSSKENLGKSRKEVYTEVFNHPDSPNNISESQIANRYGEGRFQLISSAVTNNLNFNPDFPNGQVNYSYLGSNKVNRIGFKSSDEVKIAEDGTLSIRPIRGSAESEKNTPLNTGDVTGRYTPNISANRRVDFNGEVSDDQVSGSYRSREDATISGGGYGSDVVFESSASSSPDYRPDDIHNAEIPVTNIATGVFNPPREGKLGIFEFKEVNEDNSYDENPLNSGVV